MQTPPNDNRSTPAQFRSKLITYLTGVAIGFTLLGGIYYQKHRATQRLQKQKQSEQAQQPTDQPTTPASEPTP